MFYNAKIEDLEKNLKDLESIVQGKSNNLQVVEEGRYRETGFMERLSSKANLVHSFETEGYK